MSAAHELIDVCPRRRPTQCPCMAKIGDRRCRTRLEKKPRFAYQKRPRNCEQKAQTTQTNGSEIKIRCSGVAIGCARRAVHAQTNPMREWEALLESLHIGPLQPCYATDTWTTRNSCPETGKFHPRPVPKFPKIPVPDTLPNKPQTNFQKCQFLQICRFFVDCILRDFKLQLFKIIKQIINKQKTFYSFITYMLGMHKR